MHLGDWVNAVVNAAIGVFLGIAADAMFQLVASGLWFVALSIVLVFAAFFGLVWLFEAAVDRLFPSGLGKARRTRTSGRLPLVRLLSLPTGGVVGVVLSRLDLAGPLLAAFS
jgi:hypothetical protein